jgi:hypothetical protein
MKSKEQTDPTDSILDQLSDARVFSINKHPDGFAIHECCDYYFEATLSKEEMLQLIEELKSLVGQ